MAKTLIIDEISMVCGHTFDKLNSLAKLLRKSKKPFGGIRESKRHPFTDVYCAIYELEQESLRRHL